MSKKQETTEPIRTARGQELPVKVRDALVSAGLDVARLAHETMPSIELELKSKAERSEVVIRTLRNRLASVAVPDDKRKTMRDHLGKVTDAGRLVKQALRAISSLAPAPAFPAPTKERVRHSTGKAIVDTKDSHGTPLRAPRTRLQWPVDAIGDNLSAEAYNAAYKLREAYQIQLATPKGVDLHAAGGGAPGSRMLVTDAKLRAAEEFRAVFKDGLALELQFIVANFVLEIAPPGKDAPLTLEEFGCIYGTSRDARAWRPVALATLKTACYQISNAYREYSNTQRIQRKGHLTSTRDGGR